MTDPDRLAAAREALAAIEHEQWMTWAEAVAPEVDGLRAERWQAYMVPYAELPEDVKEYDRKWADKVLAADPTLICPDPADHALADAVRRLPDDFTIDIRYEPPPEPVAWTVRVADRFVGGDSLLAAIEEALRDD
jgi:hypothetical protein